MGQADQVDFSPLARRVLEQRYLRRAEDGRILETPEGLFRRVARTVAAAEHRYGSPQAAAQMEEAFYQAMLARKFLPNSPTLMNAGTSRQQLAACFVLPVEDNMESILGAVRDMALIHQSGGGTGFDFSHLRPRRDPVRTTGGVASGPVSFMQIFNTTTEVIKQGGRRRGANMGILRYDHPDIFEFIQAKATPGAFSHFNLSVAVSDAFMEHVARDQTYSLINPRTGSVTKTVPARQVFDLICQQALETGDPGLVFLDAINRANPLPDLGRLEVTNPCGEQPLLPYEACNLGSINLARLARRDQVDWQELDRLVCLGVTFLDDVIDQSHYPLPQIDALTRANRKIGLGVMGLADLFISLGIPYDAPEALDLAERLMARIQATAVAQSEQLAQVRGPFPNFSRSRWHQEGQPPRRHATLTTIAPTGTISLIAGTSSGIEPLFAIAYMRRALEGQEFFQVHPLFIQKLREAGLDPNHWLPQISPVGRVRPFTALPESLRRLFPTTYEVTAEIQLQMQAAFQRHVDNAVSKTVNLPPDATIAQVAQVFQLAYRLGLKGVTVYRYGARAGQVLNLPPEPLTLASEFSEECRLCSV
ncbi:MAG: ribonucleoside-diphosphate reductase, adenosylcobalamin-dependent [Desulfobacca sp. 4484_104]|nr:MAG: ribonucleoside-diphosphate reductase, adenosylcobalamin-dependent [Desulfobacca sp. 4484_104]RLA88679.1 MAG: adenosylcobalamin-dependent ribonucleoside-diphosphate reductase [Deltaproteobacteria bacterium]